MARTSRTIVWSLIGLVILLAAGTLGYTLLEGWNLLDSLYMAVITLTGYREVGPLSMARKLYTLAFIILGLAALALIARMLAQALLAEELGKFLGRRKLEKEIARLKEHFIICGYGRMGRLICRELSSNQVSFMVIENDDKTIEQLSEDGFLYLKGDATEEEMLLKAGIDRAKGLVAVVSSDAHNLFITMTARQLNPKLHILARAEEEASERKLVRAGANRVVSPYIIGAQHLAQAILRPAVIDFIELATKSQSMELFMEELPVAADSSLVGKNLRESGLRQNLGLMVVAIEKASGQMIFNPGADLVLEEGDQLVTLGEKKALKGLESLLRYKEQV